jgi:hypothetical protein
MTNELRRSEVNMKDVKEANRLEMGKASIEKN